MAKQIIFNHNDSSDVRDKIASGIKKLADAVKVTLGPTGRVVMFERDFGDPVITKDGVTVAREVDLPDPFENMGVKMVRQATSKTASIAGDGTTTATIYTQAIFEAGLKHINSGANPQSVKRGIDKAINAIVERLQKVSKPVTDVEKIKQVAICSANQDELAGGMVAEAIDKVGSNGVVTIEEGSTLDTRVQVVDGFQFNQGYVNQHFATDPKTLKCEYDKPAIWIIDDKLVNIQQFVQLLDRVMGLLKGRPLIIIAEEFADEIIAVMAVNKVRGTLNVAAVKAPGFGDRKRDTLDDVAVATGATIFSKSGGASLSDIKISDFGTCDKIKIDRDTTTIIDGGGDDEKVAERIALIKDQLEITVTEFDRERIQERLARLTGGVAQIVVGGATEVEVREKKDRIDDALHACKAAIAEGVLPGGGVAAIHARNADIQVADEDEAAGVNIVIKALEAPLRQLAINTGVDDGVVVDKVMSSTDHNFGYNAATREYGDMIEFGIIVPTKVERIALQNASSVASLLLTTDCMITTIPENIINEDSGHI